MAFHVWKKALGCTTFQPHWKAFFNPKASLLAQKNDALRLTPLRWNEPNYMPLSQLVDLQSPLGCLHASVGRRLGQIAMTTSSRSLMPTLGVLWVFPLLKSLLPVVVAFLLPTTDTLDHRRVGNGTHRHGLFQEPMEELPAMA